MFALILDTELRRRKVRDRAEMTFVKAEPYIGHLCLDRVGDHQGLTPVKAYLESGSLGAGVKPVRRLALSVISLSCEPGG